MDETVGPVALACLPGCQEVAARRCQEIAAREHSRSNHLSAFEDLLPRHVHVVRSAAAAHARNPAVGQCAGQLCAEVRRLLRDRYAGRQWVFRMHMDIPQAGKQIGAIEFDDTGISRIG